MDVMEYRNDFLEQVRARASAQENFSRAAFVEYCAAVDAATGNNLWATPIDTAPWDPAYDGDGGSGSYPHDLGDGPRTTPSVTDGRVIALSGCCIWCA